MCEKDAALAAKVQELGEACCEAGEKGRALAKALEDGAEASKLQHQLQHSRHYVHRCIYALLQLLHALLQQNRSVAAVAAYAQTRRCFPEVSIYHTHTHTHTHKHTNTHTHTHAHTHISEKKTAGG
jgi:hypothetical protein